MPEMFNPTLPADQVITVPDSAVPHWRGSGWLLVSERQDTPAPEPEPAPAPTPAPVLAAAPAKSDKPTTSRPKPDGSAD